jgi:hypothetical protein
MEDRIDDETGVLEIDEALEEGRGTGSGLTDSDVQETSKKALRNAERGRRWFFIEA